MENSQLLLVDLCLACNDKIVLGKRNKGPLKWRQSALRKLVKNSRIFDLVWDQKYDIKTGLKDGYKWFTTNAENVTS